MYKIYDMISPIPKIDLSRFLFDRSEQISESDQKKITHFFQVVAKKIRMRNSELVKPCREQLSYQGKKIMVLQKSVNLF